MLKEDPTLVKLKRSLAYYERIEGKIKAGQVLTAKEYLDWQLPEDKIHANRLSQVGRG